MNRKLWEKLALNSVLCLSCFGFYIYSVLKTISPSLLPQTTILAAIFDGGVVIGSDSRASMGGWGSCLYCYPLIQQSDCLVTFMMRQTDKKMTTIWLQMSFKISLITTDLTFLTEISEFCAFVHCTDFRNKLRVTEILCLGMLTPLRCYWNK